MTDDKVTIFCALETYSLVGGLQNFNRRVIEHLDGFSRSGAIAPATVILMRDNPTDSPLLPFVRFCHPGANRFAFAWKFLLSVRRAETLLLGHVNLLPLSLVARLVRPGLPILLFVHGDEVWNAPEHRPMRFYEPWMLRAVTRIASVSRYTAGRMASSFHAPASKFLLFPNAVDPIEARATQKFGPPTLLTVTRIGPGDREKNVDKALRAFARLDAELPELVYEIVGDGSLRDELEALARELGISNRVRFLGRVDDATLCEAYERADVFILPSSKEGFGIVYLEAWQRGLPVICSREGASSEIVSDGIDGFAVDPNDIDALAERLRLLLSNRATARAFGERGRVKVEENYLDAVFETRFHELLRELRDISNN